LDFLNLWRFIAPPVVGGIIGYFTNDVAIQMLFRPYKAIYIGNRKLPFTPGLIPANQERLAKRISDTIMESLLTPDELHEMARRLLQTDRVQGAILWVLQLAVEQVRSKSSQKTVDILAGILQDLLSESLPRLLRVLARREDFLQDQLNQLFDQVLLNFQLTPIQSAQFADWLLQGVLPPEVLRLALIDVLNDRNIQVIDESFREKSSGTYWVIANLFGLRNTLTRLRTFCIDDRETTNARLAELIQILGIQERLQKWLTNLSLQSLPISTVRQLRRTVRESVRAYLQEQGPRLLEGFRDSVDWQNFATLLLNRLQSAPVITLSLEVISQELAQILERYLEAELESIMKQVIPILNLDQAIADRVKATSPQDLEAGIQGIVKSELQAIVNLGGILGFLIGVLQSLSLLFT
jgi:uncharacterized membrane protein YheB (UPF0754 family)